MGWWVQGCRANARRRRGGDRKRGDPVSLGESEHAKRSWWHIRNHFPGVSWTASPSCNEVYWGEAVRYTVVRFKVGLSWTVISSTRVLQSVPRHPPLTGSGNCHGICTCHPGIIPRLLPYGGCFFVLCMRCIQYTNFIAAARIIPCVNLWDGSLFPDSI